MIANTIVPQVESACTVHLPLIANTIIPQLSVIGLPLQQMLEWLPPEEYDDPCIF